MYTIWKKNGMFALIELKLIACVKHLFLYFENETCRPILFYDQFFNLFPLDVMEYDILLKNRSIFYLH